MKFNKGTLIAIVAIFSAIVLVVVGISSVSANAIAFEEKVTEAQAAVKVQEKRRADLLPLLADAIKAYDQHEYETLLSVVNARKAQDGTISDDTVNEIKERVNIVLENYPQLSSQDNYKEFMKESAITENIIAETREAYNKAVTRYNTYVRHPIHKFFLALTGYEAIEFQKLSYDVSEDAPKNLFN